MNDPHPFPHRVIDVGGTPVRVTDMGPSDRLRTLPYSIRVLLECAIRRGGHDSPDVARLHDWQRAAAAGESIDLYATRVFLHDTNGVPTIVDLASMRAAAAQIGADPMTVNPQIPAELVIDHSVIVDVFGTKDAAERNVAIEYERNAERYRFLRWAEQTFDGFVVVPPGTGIMHQVNIEYLARVVERSGDLAYPDVCLGTDSHTTMVDALGVVGWGIGGIEAEAVLLGEPYSMTVPKVIGVHLSGQLPPGATATDLVLTITEMLRQYGVVGAFVEFTGPGLAVMPVADRATIANMCPEFGATLAYFPIDAATIDYLRFTGRPDERIALVEAYAREQSLWHDPDEPITYDDVIRVDLGSIRPSLAGPQRPQDRVDLDGAGASFRRALSGITGQSPDDDAAAIELGGAVHELRNGDVVIAAITSCTNTSNPSVMVAAGLLARNAAGRGLRSKPWVKTSLSPGSRVVTDYLDLAGLTPHLDSLGFSLAGYGCMTCIGASGPLIDEVQTAVREAGLSVASVLSGNRNFDGRINPDVRLNYLASPPLVVAYALAGTMDVDLTRDPLGTDDSGEPVYLADIWPGDAEIQDTIRASITPGMYTEAYSRVFHGDEHWRGLETPTGPVFPWDEASTYLRRPPYFDDLAGDRPWSLKGARVLASLGDQITTDHLSPAGAIPAHTPAGRYLTELGVPRFELNTYASRRGNHEVMMRGTLANVRLRNRLVPGVEGGSTVGPVSGNVVPIYDAALEARAANIPLIILGGRLYGAGSSRDWAAKGPALLGVRAVIAASFERIHRSNLIGMGILPLEFMDGADAAGLGLTGFETFDIVGDPLRDDVVAVRADDIAFTVRVRLDTDREKDYFRHGGIMKTVLRHLPA
ncbi:MAG TPA: aconitate hydratase AcnA [Microbacterium sp.]|uniref:aconitate hydratase AcnA n=1 Tax=Microbacterium sp. TaxID=51671 RepID=UPI002C4F2DDA|nr:aconitate hydratase AcnA [Microbacterium sp.]HWI30027.1 aconitate hydratase AcnA [Microbacterium sp.]